MNEYESGSLPLGDHIRAENRFADSRRCDKDADVVLEKGVSGLLLEGSEFTLESHLEAFAVKTLVINNKCHTVTVQDILDIVAASAR